VWGFSTSFKDPIFTLSGWVVFHQAKPAGYFLKKLFNDKDLRKRKEPKEKKP